jgi:hypothetical protein
VLLNVPLVGVLLLLRRWYQPHNYLQLVVQLVIAGAVYGLCLLWLFKTKHAFQIGDLAAKDQSNDQSKDKPTAIENGMGTPVEAYQQDN